MNSVHRFLAFDCGATSGRAVLATFAEGRFSMEEVYRFPNAVLEAGGKYYWNVFSMYSHLLSCLRQLAARGLRPDSIGIDTWGVDFGLLAADGTLLSLPRAYRDPYTAGVPERVFASVPRAELYGRTGIQMMDFNTIFQLYAQREEGFSPYLHAQEMLFLPDLLAYLLTGEKVCEYTIASTSGMLDPRTRQFDGELLARLGLRGDLLRPIVEPGTLVGMLRPALAAETGLGAVPVIAVAGHDTASAIAAVPAGDERFAYLSSGTWSLMGIEAPAPIINEASARCDFTNEGGIDGTTRFLKNITGMWLLEQCRKVWSGAGRDYSYAELVAMAGTEAAFPGRIDPDDPRFAHPADMVAEIRAALGTASLSDAQLVSCIYHSLAEKYRAVIGQLRDFAPFPIERLHVVGGGSANELMNQLTADATGLPVVAGPTEATAIGNLMIQARTAGLVSDRWAMRRLIAEQFSVKTFYPQI